MRGIAKTFVGTVENLAGRGEEPFDGLLCMGNTLGPLGTPQSAGRFFAALRQLSHEGTRLVGTTLDPYATTEPIHLQYHEQNRVAGRFAGEGRLRVRHGRLATPWLELLWLSPDELEQLARPSGWEVTDLLPGAIYGAELRLR
jgi:hypothetical protein